MKHQTNDTQDTNNKNETSNKRHTRNKQQKKIQKNETSNDTQALGKAAAAIGSGLLLDFGLGIGWSGLGP